ncbi:hypothetical protein HPB47_015729 [Ixodes persulcatus]|uniref:Uncharacterized protein n=1 Tax=Ixodes persulcatus TaxID=34615 RepID=A0AC60QSQ4_IXOPE|nr:hypothetical protein HPB47_015729 [Ixodes persulcatus]
MPPTPVQAPVTLQQALGFHPPTSQCNNSTERKAVRLPCIHTLCMKCHDLCVDEGSACPVDQKPFCEDDVEQLEVPHKYILNRTVACWNAPKGCSFIGPVACLLDHYKECDFNVVPCCLCHSTVLQSDILEHFKNGCSNPQATSLPTDNPATQELGNVSKVCLEMNRAIGKISEDIMSLQSSLNWCSEDARAEGTRCKGQLEAETFRLTEQLNGLSTVYASEFTEGLQFLREAMADYKKHVRLRSVPCNHALTRRADELAFAWSIPPTLDSLSRQSTWLKVASSNSAGGLNRHWAGKTLAGDAQGIPGAPPPRPKVATPKGYQGIAGFSDALDWRPTLFQEPIIVQKACILCRVLYRKAVRLPCNHTLCTKNPSAMMTVEQLEVPLKCILNCTECDFNVVPCCLCHSTVLQSDILEHFKNGCSIPQATCLPTDSPATQDLRNVSKACLEMNRAVGKISEDIMSLQSSLKRCTEDVRAEGTRCKGQLEAEASRLTKQLNGLSTVRAAEFTEGLQALRGAMADYKKLAREELHLQRDELTEALDPQVAAERTTAKRLCDLTLL